MSSGLQTVDLGRASVESVPNGATRRCTYPLGCREPALDGRWSCAEHAAAHEQDLLDLIAAGRRKHEALVERVHGFETNHIEETPTDE